MRRLSSWFSCVRLTMVSRSDSFWSSVSRIWDCTPTSWICSAETVAASSASDGVEVTESASVRGTPRYLHEAHLVLQVESVRLARISVNAAPRRLRRDRDAFVDHLEDGVADDDVLIA